MTTVALAWVTKKRHIAVDGKILCEPKHKTTGYSVNNGQYNSVALSGLPDYNKTTPDRKLSHSDGIIPFLHLDEQPIFVDRSSICKACQKKYDKLISHGN